MSENGIVGRQIFNFVKQFRGVLKHAINLFKVIISRVNLSGTLLQRP